MFSMQYGFDFPETFDIDAVRRRAVEIGPRFDELPGLRYKGFLVSGHTALAPARYSPFYVWEDVEGMQSFLASAAFQALVDKYGRPIVDQWLPLAHHQAEDAAATTPLYATQEIVAIGDVQNIGELASRAAARVRELTGHPGFHTAIAALDASTWRHALTVFWSATPEASWGRVYEVPYFSRPTKR
ncbi:DUF4865 family protein [Mitsuaria sp. 7]|uniref:DUF4865 family protein n=1 Tax=Mitsuaria sp. 7 TaxID=1658665 RepID=UPI00082AEFB0|nr:DUF4865 family protein [Mitsuaria sp. 7]